VQTVANLVATLPGLGLHLLEEVGAWAAQLWQLDYRLAGSQQASGGHAASASVSKGQEELAGETVGGLLVVARALAAVAMAVLAQPGVVRLLLAAGNAVPQAH
jgi:hypothetical protein